MFCKVDIVFFRVSKVDPCLHFPCSLHLSNFILPSFQQLNSQHCLICTSLSNWSINFLLTLVCCIGICTADIIKPDRGWLVFDTQELRGYVSNNDIFFHDGILKKLSGFVFFPLTLVAGLIPLFLMTGVPMKLQD